MQGPTLRRLRTTVIGVVTVMAFLVGSAPRSEAGRKPQPTIGIVCPVDADSPVRIAARELAAGLGALYDMEKDWRETTNLYDSYPQVVQELKAILKKQHRDGRTVPVRKSP
jgi:hypothetical protein